jgi:hypothetical protein
LPFWPRELSLDGMLTGRAFECGMPLMIDDCDGAIVVVYSGRRPTQVPAHGRHKRNSDHTSESAAGLKAQLSDSALGIIGSVTMLARKPGHVRLSTLSAFLPTDRQFEACYGLSRLLSTDDNGVCRVRFSPERVTAVFPWWRCRSAILSERLWAAPPLFIAEESSHGHEGDPR